MTEQLKRMMPLEEYKIIRPFLTVWNLESLDQETSVELTLELMPEMEAREGDDDPEDYDWHEMWSYNFPEHCVCKFEFRGRDTGTWIELFGGGHDHEIKENDGYLEALVAARNVLCQWIATSCPAMESLSLDAVSYTHLTLPTTPYV